MSRFPRPLTAALAALSAAVLLAGSVGCSSDDAASPSSTTTGIADPITTTTTSPSTPSTSSADGSADLPGLWLASPTGISDESGELWARPRAGETLRSPLDDGIGGVIYLRCTGTQATCSIEDVPTKGASPTVHGTADSLLAVGTYREQRVVLTTMTDPSIVPSFEDNRSQLVAQLIELDADTVTTIAGWFGWESGPFAADVEQNTFVNCSGEGEMCELATGSDPTQLAPVAGVEPSTVMALALDPAATRATWVEAAPMSGQVSVHALELPNGTTTEFELRPDGSPLADDAVTDGNWVAVRSGTTVTLTQLATTGPAATAAGAGTRTVPAGVTEIALRASGGGGGPGLAL